MWTEMDKKQIEESFDTYNYYLEDGYVEVLENDEAIKKMEQVALEGLKCGLKARSLYFLSLVYLYRDDTDKAIESFKQSALSGHLTSAIEYANRVEEGDLEALAILKYYVDAKCDVGQPAWDNYHYHMGKLTTDDKDKVMKLIDGIHGKINQESDGIVYS
jgi:hypothetical protein